jgi:hypothetical protein
MHKKKQIDQVQGLLLGFNHQKTNLIQNYWELVIMEA